MTCVVGPDLSSVKSVTYVPGPDKFRLTRFTLGDAQPRAAAAKSRASAPR